MKILLVEDDEIFVNSLTASLGSENYTVESVQDGEMGWEYAQATQYDIIILDVNLPGLDGFSLCRRLRQADYKGAILLLTASGDDPHKIAGLDAGADDYVVKPCSLEEISARVRALLRRPHEVASPILQWGNLQLDPKICKVTFRQAEISLSPKEYGLLELFLRHPQRVFSSSLLLERLWGFDEAPGEETIRTHIRRLRRKLKQAGVSELIETVYGMGYRLMPAPDIITSKAKAAVTQSETELACPDKISTPLAAPTERDAATPLGQRVASVTARTMAAAALAQFSDLLKQRLAILQQVVDAAAAGNLSDELQHHGKLAAHKLAGSLGMFGLAEGSHISRALEEHLQCELSVIEPLQIGAWVSQLHQMLETALNTATSQALHGEASDLTLPTTSASEHRTTSPSIWLIAHNSELAAALASATLNTGHLLQVIDISQAQQRLSQHPPVVLLIDLEQSADLPGLLPFLATVNTTAPQVAILALLHPNSFVPRVEITRRCSCTFLSSSTTVKQIVETVLEVCQRQLEPTFRILAVDDDVTVLESLTQQLSAWGMQVISLSNPGQLWDELTQHQPDLLLLDVEMPELGGIELCQVIRSDRQWDTLPILFLTARRDAETIQNIYQAGADDYIAKPFTESVLATRILNRLNRNRLVQQAAAIDPVTGLMLEQQALTDFDRAFSLARRYHQPYCLVMISAIVASNSMASHQPGFYRTIICEIANALRANLRQEDVLALAKNNAFMIGMYGINQNQAKKRLASLEKELYRIIHPLTNGSCAPVVIATKFAVGPNDGDSIASLRQLIVDKFS